MKDLFQSNPLLLKKNTRGLITYTVLSSILFLRGSLAPSSHEQGQSSAHEQGQSSAHEQGQSSAHEQGQSSAHEQGPSSAPIYNELKGSSLVKGSSINGSLNLKGSKTEELSPNGAVAPASRKKSKRLKPSADDMAGEIEKLKNNYPPRYRAIIEQALGQIALTRKDHSISEGIIEGFLADLEKYQLWQIAQGIRIYIRGGYAQKGKDEKYLMGIIRGQDKNEGEFAYTDMRLDVGVASPSRD